MLIIALGMIAGSLYVVKQWEQAAILRFGRIIKIMGLGLHVKVPILDSIRRLDLRTQTIDLLGQSAITKDNTSIGIDAVAFVKIEDAEKVIMQIVNYADVVSKYAQIAIRNIMGRYNLDDLLESREEIAEMLKEEIDKLSKDWGKDVTRVGLQDISLPADMKRAFAVQTEAERESRAILIKANAELKASEKLRDAAKNMTDPNAMQLRILSTINDVSKDRRNMIILVLPLETLKVAGVQGIGALSSIKTKFEQA